MAYEIAVIVNEVEKGKVGAGCIVTLLYDGDEADDAERFLLGHIEEQAEGLEVISPGSPLGEALIGAREGDTVSYEAPGGVLKVKVLAVDAP